MNTKLVLLTILGLMTILLGICAVALATILSQKKSQIQQRKQRKNQGSTTNSYNRNNQNHNKNNPSDTSTSSPEFKLSYFQPERDLRQHRQYAPDPTSGRAAADAHFFQSMQIFQKTDTYPLGDAGYDIYSNYGMSVKINYDNFQGNDHYGGGSAGGGFGEWFGFGNKQVKEEDAGSFVTRPLLAAASYFQKIANFWNNRLFRRKSKPKHDANDNNNNQTSLHNSSKNPSVPISNHIAPIQAYIHLEKSAKNGNPDAQHLLANLLASSLFLPIDHHHYNYNNSSSKLHSIPTDYGSSPPLTLVLWHYAALSGHMESQLAMGYRYFQANQNRKDRSALMFHHQMGNSIGSASSNYQNQDDFGTIKGDYGLEHATCETALAYYEEAAHTMMDELERGIWRGKVKPADDRHMLAEIHFLGGSQLLLQGDNKPDELEEHLEYFRIRASSSQTNPFAPPTPPDVNAALTLANFHHYGIRGVKQDLSLALKYYEIAADAGSREAAGIAGKFHLLGISYEGDEMAYFHHFGLNPKVSSYEFVGDTDTALKYLSMGAPGGVKGCDPKSQRKSKKGDSNDSMLLACDGEAMNGLGLVHLIGIPGKVKPNFDVATSYFRLARDRGCADASFHLGMIKLGWWSSKKTYTKNEVKIDKVTLSAPPPVAEKLTKAGIHDIKSTQHKSQFFPKDSEPIDSRDFPDEIETLTRKRLETRKQDVQMGLGELTKAANKGHMQALHRLATFNSHGIPFLPPEHKDMIDLDTNILEGTDKWILKPKCSTALNLFKLVLDAAPVSTKRTRRAYKQYIAGDISGSLKNYMAAAETGNLVGMMNAAWLLERNCPLPKEYQWKCNQASLRYWTEAARLGNTEALMNIGDYYYYNKFDEAPGNNVKLPKSGQAWIVGGIQKVIDYILFPERLWNDGKIWLIRFTKQSVLRHKRKKQKYVRKVEEATTCADEEGQTCSSPLSEASNGIKDDGDNDKKEDLDYNYEYDHFKLAASYYKKAGLNPHNSPRANFNLGFMHQWGIGLAQDFPLAKRHYDLAHDMNPVAVKLALYGMRWHESLVKWYWSSKGDGRIQGGKWFIILSHFLSWETGVIVVLSIFLQQMLQKRRIRNV